MSQIEEQDKIQVSIVVMVLKKKGRVLKDMKSD